VVDITTTPSRTLRHLFCHTPLEEQVGSLIGEDRGSDIVIGKDIHGQLYSPEYNAFIEGHRMQIFKFPENWVWMVEAGNGTSMRRGGHMR
jgi:hypothetical protein